MSDIFITSDTFFGRSQAIKKFKRPFESVEEMDDTMIDNWNSVVKEDDIIYHLGNFAWSPTDIEYLMEHLNGHIIFLLGEHDKALLDLGVTYPEKATILENEILGVEEIGILSHWPLEVWEGKKHGIFHFHGHTIKTLKTDISKMNRVNVCIDNWNYTPCKLSDLLQMFKEYKNQNKQ